MLLFNPFQFNVLLFLHTTGRSQHKDAETRSALVFDQAVRDGAKPNVITYSSLLSALSRSRWVSHWNRFQQWYSKRERRKRKEKHWSVPIYIIIKINITSSNSIVLSVLSLLYCTAARDKNAPFRADTVFENMIEAGVQPDTMAWTILITIWSRSRLVEKENKVQEIFMRYVHTSHGFCSLPLLCLA